MLKTKIAIVFQLTGMINTFAGFAFMLLIPQQRLLTGMVLALIGSTLFLLGRMLLKTNRRLARPVPIANYREWPEHQEYYASSGAPKGRF